MSERIADCGLRTADGKSRQMAVGSQQTQDNELQIAESKEFRLSQNTTMAGGFRNLLVYQKAFALAMEIFELTKSFPKEEQYSLTSQIRRSSRSVCSNIGEAYRKRQYVAHFVSKISDADMENTETQVWLDFSLASKYINIELFEDLNKKSEEVGRMLSHMISHPEKYA